ncbi:ABC transporter permease [Rhodobium gokarnense]|uniref:Peptide/nickel transport system permease protein n=1 Tax=Rhodobium gokarnense TaxID=364296 RepID=A0ABT3H7Y6_9HYPH|nr:ABC transporter permease [Rhodobium gokarnense]MCW2306500.1 peptide/nickel transport system permease protein [Rhodobium gokarnense]
MLGFILRRLGVMLATMVALTFIVFSLVNLEPNLRKLALEQGNIRMSDEAIETWLENNGYRRPFLLRYGEWLTNAMTGELGHSTRFRRPVNDVLPERLGYTGILAFWVMATMVPGALIIGVLAGMREGSKTDRSLSIFSIITTATPEYVSGIIFTVIFATWLGWFKGVAKAGDIDFWSFTLPVMTMALYGMGYIARMTRASMTEVMTSQYIRTARLKGLSFPVIVLRHALRNALIAPFTVIMLQFPWLLTGVVIVEKLFNYKGFGWVLVEAADNNDIDLLLACSLVSVAVVIVTQLISDVGYAFLNPRIRVQ